MHAATFAVKSTLRHLLIDAVAETNIKVAMLINE